MDTRVVEFSILSDGVTKESKESVVGRLRLSKVIGDTYYDKTDGTLYVLQNVQKLSDNLYTNERGSVFSIENEYENPQAFLEEKEV